MSPFFFFRKKKKYFIPKRKKIKFNLNLGHFCIKLFLKVCKMELVFTIKEFLQNIYNLMDPRRTENFFENLKLQPMKKVFYYLAILGLFTVIGYFLRYSLFPPKYPEIGLKIAFLFYLIGIYAPTGIISILAMSSAFTLAGKKVVKREVKKEEAISIIGYSFMPELIGGFFGILIETWVLHILLIVYSMYLLYKGIKVRFDPKISIRGFIFILASGFIFSTIFFILVAILLGIPRQYIGLDWK